jgi:hypothetical protein
MTREDLDSHVAAAAQADFLANFTSKLPAKRTRRAAAGGFSHLTGASTLFPQSKIIFSRLAEIPPVFSLMTRMTLTPARLSTLTVHSVTVMRIVAPPNNRSQQFNPAIVSS